MPNTAYQPIHTLPPDWKELVDDEVKDLHGAWVAKKENLGKAEVLRKFNQKLARSWAIETGIIEGLYDIERGVTETLVESGLSLDYLSHGSVNKPPHEVLAHLKDHQSVLDGLFSFIKEERPLTLTYIRELHNQLTKSQKMVDIVDSLGNPVQRPLERGNWKSQPNNPTRPDRSSVHHYCPPNEVGEQMQFLVDTYRKYAVEGVDAPILAAWFHHRFTQIHPFQDGNGRMARTLASLVLIKANAFPFTVRREKRAAYIEALEAADAGELKPLVGFLDNQQKQAFLEGLDLIKEVEQEQDIVALIGAGFRSRLAVRRKRAQAITADLDKRTNWLREATEKRLESVAQLFNEQFQGSGIDGKAWMAHDSPTTEHYYRRDTVHVAKELNYFANMGEYYAWRILIIRENNDITKIVFVFQGIGHDAGVRGVCAFLTQNTSPNEEDSDVATREPVRLCDTSFTYARLVTEASLRSRFERWLDEALKKGLHLWQQTP